MPDSYTPAEQRLIDLWNAHADYEFKEQDAVKTIGTMVAEPYVNHIPTLTGGQGKTGLLEFYRDRFIPKMPPDIEMELITRTVGQSRVIDEFVIRFTHTVEMDWMLPGVPPTGKRVEVTFVAVVQFDGEQVAHEHIHWDQGTVLAQLGLIDASKLPVAGAEAARKALDRNAAPSNQLLAR